MNDQKTSVERRASEGVAQKLAKNPLSTLLSGYTDYARYELGFAQQSSEKYRHSLEMLIKEIGDKNVEDLTIEDFVDLKKSLLRRGLSHSYITGMIYAARSLLMYCNEFLEIQTIKPKHIRPLKRVRREVIYLTEEEIHNFIATIDTHTWQGLRFRTLVEVLLGTGMRIGEVLSLTRKDIDWENREAMIIGKGNKQRKVFFTKRALDWVHKYLRSRTDVHPSLFVTRRPVGPMDRNDMWRFFARHRKLANIEKKVTPHILRHTVATNLVFNGCPLVHVKEILGHERLDTTCRYYLGIDNAKAKQAHNQFLNYSLSSDQNTGPAE